MDAGPVRAGRWVRTSGAGLALPDTVPVLAWHCSALDRHEGWAADLDGDFLRVGCILSRSGTPCALGDRNPVPDGVERPRTE